MLALSDRPTAASQLARARTECVRARRPRL